jgi:cell division septation protein DedD
MFSAADADSEPTIEKTADESSDVAASAAVVTAPDEGNYTIVVASFTSPERAQHLVEELTNAGYRARAVEHDWGPPRGRLLQVNVGGYATATEVQRALELIRELPGGYRDARIVERQ